MEQTAVFQWAAIHEAQWPELRYLHATLNGARVPMGLAKKLKDAGMKSGPSDIYLDVRRQGFSGLRIELKRGGNKTLGIRPGRPSKEQLEWLQHYAQEGFCVALCFGAQAAIDQIRSYLSLPKEITDG